MAGGVIVASFVLPQAWVERFYARGVYPVINAVLVPASSVVSLPLTGILVCCAPFAAAWLLLRSWRASARRGLSRWRRAAAVARGALGCAIVGYALFLSTWGLGYRRTPIEQRLGLGDATLSRPDVDAFVTELLGRIQVDLPTGAVDFDRALQSYRVALQAWIGEHDGWSPALPPTPKQLPAGSLLTFGVSGVISPFLLEAHVDSGLPVSTRIGVAAHEFAHLAGVCGEADADLVSCLAGLRADDADARYAVLLRILVDLRAESPEARARIDAELPPRVREDLAALRAAVARYRVPGLADVSWHIYDSYLRVQGVEAGVADYSRGVSLLLRAWQRGLVRL